MVRTMKAECEMSDYPSLLLTPSSVKAAVELTHQNSSSGKTSRSAKSQLANSKNSVTRESVGDSWYVGYHHQRRNRLTANLSINKSYHLDIEFRLYWQTIKIGISGVLQMVSGYCHVPTLFHHSTETIFLSVGAKVYSCDPNRRTVIEDFVATYLKLTQVKASCRWCVSAFFHGSYR